MMSTRGVIIYLLCWSESKCLRSECDLGVLDVYGSVAQSKLTDSSAQWFLVGRLLKILPTCVSWQMSGMIMWDRMQIDARKDL